RVLFRSQVAVERLLQIPQAVDVDVDQGHVGAHPQRDAGRAGAYVARADDDHVRGRHAGHAAQEPAAAAPGLLQELRADLHGHAPGPFAHPRQLRRRSISVRVSSGTAARCKYVNKICPGRSHCASWGSGSFTLTTMSARSYTDRPSSASAAPAAAYSSSAMPLPAPAPRCTSTEWPL